MFSTINNGGAELALKALRTIILGRKLSFGFNISDRCPIGCSCYWRARERVTEMSDADVVGFFEDMRAAGYLNSFCIGGEPYVRPRLLEMVAGILPINFVVTSGTTPLIHLERTIHNISIDGGNAETHNRVRNSPQLFERIIKNVTKARERFDPFPLLIHSTLNALNYREIEEILSFWSGNGLADGVYISTFTPIQGAGDEHLRMSVDQLEWVVSALLEMKKAYPEFLLNTKAMIKALRPGQMSSQNPRRCRSARQFIPFDAAGDQIEQCIFGAKADCSMCGCVVTTFAKTFASPFGVFPALSLVKKIAEQTNLVTLAYREIN